MQTQEVIPKTEQKSDSNEKPSVWTIVNNIYEKEEGLLPEPFVRSLYNPWLINLALSNNIDTWIFGQQMNGLWGLDPYMQYVYLYYSIEKRRRRGKWNKRDESFDDKMALVKEYFNYSTFKAREIVPLIDQLQLWDTIESTLRKGGRGKLKRGKRSLNIDIPK